MVKKKKVKKEKVFFLCYTIDSKEPGRLNDGTKDGVLTTFSVGRLERVLLNAKTRRQAEKEAYRLWWEVIHGSLMRNRIFFFPDWKIEMDEW